MVTLDKRIDAYIRKAAPFAQPILTELRARLHAACPEVKETMKWSAPSFEHHGILCGMAAFKAHCVFGFWKHELVVGETAGYREAMGSYGRLTALSDLPGKAEFARLVKKAMRLNEDGVKVVRQKHPKKPVRMPPALQKALAGNAAARKTFEAFSPSHQREYMEWIGEAKQEATRERRLATALEWLAEGKPRHWKYSKC